MRVYAYTRVSTRDQADEGFSLAAQERAIRQYCAQQAWPEPVFYTDAGRSGYTDVTAKRPAFARLLEDAAAGGCDVLVVHRLDRFARSLVVTLRELRRLQAAGVGFVSVAEQMDFATPIGRVFLAMLAALSEYYSDNLSAETKKGLAARKLAGYPSPKRPYGALPTADGKAWVVDPARAPDLARILAVAAAHPQDEAAAILNAEGVPTRLGGPWWGRSVAVLVAAAAWLADQPPPWPERQAAAALRLPAPPVRADATVRMLTGLLRCGHCGARITYHPGKPGFVNLRCNPRPFATGGCVGGPRKASAAHYEAAVAAWVAGLPAVAALQPAAARLAGEGDPAHAERQGIAEARRKVKLQHDLGLVSDAELVATAAALDARERALPALPRAGRELHDLVAARETFGAVPPALQRAILRVLVREVVVTGRAVRVEPSPALAALLADVARAAADEWLAG